MAIRLVAFAVLLAAVIPIYGQQKGPKAQKPQNDTKSVKTSDAHGPTVVIVGNEFVAKPDSDDSKKQSESYFKRLLSPEILPTVALVIIGALGICAAVRTLKAIEHQATLMEAPLRQWVEPGKMCHSFLRPRNRLQIQFSVVNPTDLPLTLLNSKVGFYFDRRVREVAIGPNRILTPRDQLVVQASFKLSDEQAQIFSGGEYLFVRVWGNLDHIGTLGKKQPRKFWGNLLCGKNGSQFEESAPLTAVQLGVQKHEPEDEEDDEIQQS